MKLLPVLTFVLGLAGCYGPSIIRAPNEGVSVKNSLAEIKPLSYYINANTQRVKLIFIHGVGDHNDDYVFNPRDGWLNDKSLKIVGLTKIGSEWDNGNIPVASNIYSDVFVSDKERDCKSYVSYAIGHYEYNTLVNNNHKIPVDAIVINWSPLTQWIKNNYLNYDLTQKFSEKDNRCVDDRSPTEAPPKGGKTTPERVYVNRRVKEDVVDRALTDAVLYLGKYHEPIQSGVEEALCQALHSQPRTRGDLTQRCNWTKPPSENTTYIFVTHSLGSRILFDILGKVTTGIESDKSGKSEENKTTNMREEYVNAIKNGTKVIYMLANQIPLIGIANLDPKTSSTEPQESLQLLKTRDKRENQYVVPQEPFVNFLNRETQNSFSAQPKDISVVAFSDPNDILSWGIPWWYEKDVNDRITRSSTKVHFTNVFIRNGTHYFGLLEMPTSAHQGYVKNREVWHVILCGAKNGKVLNCPPF